MAQRIEYPVDALSSCVRAILSRAPKRSDFEDEAGEVPEQVIVRNALSLGVGCADLLAGRASDDDIWEISEVGAQSLGCELADIGVHAAPGMGSSENRSAPIVEFASCDGAIPGSLEPETPSA